MIDAQAGASDVAAAVRGELGLGLQGLAQYVDESLDAQITDPIMVENAEKIAEWTEEDLSLIHISIDNMEHEFGVKCVAMPIFNQQHQVEAAISVSGPSLRFEEERIQKIAEKLKDTVRKIERRL